MQGFHRSSRLFNAAIMNTFSLIKYGSSEPLVRAATLYMSRVENGSNRVECGHEWLWLKVCALRTTDKRNKSE